MRRILLVLLCFPLFPVGAGEGKKISVITINDQIINPIAAEYIEKAITEAEQQNDQALIIELDTPGGLLSSTRQIVKRILNAEVPVVVYVSPSGSRAGSAGVFITLASHIAAMAPSTNIGAAHPVEFGESPKKKDDESLKELLKSFKRGKENPEKKDQARRAVEGEARSGSAGRGGDVSPYEDKILNDTIAWVSTIAKTRRRNVGWAVRAVRDSVSDGETKALKLGVVDLVALDLKELIQKIDGRTISLASGRKVLIKTEGATVVRQGMNLRQRILDVLINPNIAYLLMMLGFYGLLFEITHPGVWFPGVAGLICIILAFYAFHTLPTNYAGLALILLAMALFVAEVFVTSYGLLSIVGIVSMLLGSLFLVDSTAEFMQISLKIIIPIVLSTAAILFFLVSLAIRAQRQTSPVGLEAMIGLIGAVDEEKKVLIQGELWDVLSEQPLQPGEKVQVTGFSEMKLRVKKI